MITVSKPIPCQCPPCLILAEVALAFRDAGMIEAAEVFARQITWFEVPNMEGYHDTWKRPIDDLGAN